MSFLRDKLNWQLRDSSAEVSGATYSTAALSSEQSNNATGEVAKLIRIAYVDPDDLQEIANDEERSAGEVLADAFIPDDPTIRAGDFGEILSLPILAAYSEGLRIPGFRWRLKATKNDTVRGPDLIGFLLNAGAADPHPEDLLVLCEVKTRSASRRRAVVADALRDALKHFATRLAESLLHLQKLLRSQGLTQEAGAVARFSKPHASPYHKCILPMVIHDRALWEDECLTEVEVPDGFEEPIELVVITVEDLADWIDTVLAEACKLED